MTFKKAIALALTLCTLSTCFVSCKKEDIPLHAEELGLAEKCEHAFTEIDSTEKNCVVTTHYQCSNCSGLKYEYRAMSGHKVTFTPGKTASCSTNGFTNGIYCATCDITHSEKRLVPLNPNAHLFVEKTEPATLCTGSNRISSCLFCQKKRSSLPPIRLPLPKRQVCPF